MESSENDKNENVMSKLYGDYLPELNKYLDELNPEFSTIVKNFAYNNIWSRDGLDIKTKSLITISALMSSGKEDQLLIHMKGFLNAGGTIQDLNNVIIHLSIYTGFPTALNAFKTLKKLV